MIDDDLRPWVNEKMQAGENPLWAYVDKDIYTPRAPSLIAKITRYSMPGLWLLFMVFWTWNMLNTPAEQIGVSVQFALPIILFFIAISWLLKNTKFGQWLSLKRHFRNAIITDKRIILFNYDETPVTVSPDSLTAITEDYAAGQKALRLNRDKGPALYILAPTDFKPVLNIFSASLTKKATP